MITARLTTIELCAELQSRDIEPVLTARLCRDAMSHAAGRIGQRAKTNPRKVMPCTMHPAWAEPKRWPTK